jgi:hypothetical protein
MAGITRTHGGVGIEGVINGESGALVGASIKFFKIALIDSAPAAVPLTDEMSANPNGGLGGTVEALLKLVPSGILAYSVPNNSSGFVYIAVDGHAAFAATTGSTTQPGLQEIIRNCVTLPTVAGGTVNVTNSTVVAATTFTVA